MNIAVDIGNSRVKAGLFEEGKLVEKYIFNKGAFPGDFFTLIKNARWTSKLKYIGIANVGRSSVEDIEQFFNSGTPRLLLIDHKTPMPVKNSYKTPETLGIDRIIAVVGAWKVFPKGPLLSIDAGTAITYDFMDDKGSFLGGAIAPGISLRFRSLNNHTENLPLIEGSERAPLVGQSTHECIVSGVVNGLLHEIEATVVAYKKQFGEGTQIFLSGGDAEFLGNQLKCINFVNPDLVLNGINEVIEFNYRYEA